MLAAAGRLALWRLTERLKYPATFTPDPDGGYVVTFRGISEAITQGDDKAEAIFMAQDALREVIGFYFDEKRLVRMPSKAHRDDRLIDLPVSVATKALLLNQMLAQKIGASELGRIKLEHST